MEISEQFSELFLDFNSEKRLRNNADGLKVSHSQSLWTKFSSTLSKSDISEISNVKYFAENLTYVHIGLDSSEYFLHPLRVGALAGLSSPQKKVLNATVGLLHNVYEVTSVSQIDIMKNFSASVSDAVLKLTINRELQLNNAYLEEYYSEINNLPFNLGMIKVLDKIDNLYTLESTATPVQKMKYMEEIRNFVVPLCDNVSPHLSETLKSIVLHLESE
jgi:(p)ppGpp synthase/HD superfamily hydrolase